MALDGSYAGLTASIQAFMNRADLAGDPVNDAVVIGEARLNRLLRHRLMLNRATLAPGGAAGRSASGALVALPADFLQVLVATLDGGRQLDAATPQAIFDAVSEHGPGGPTGRAGPPRLYSVIGAELQLYPAPATATNLELVYYARLAPAAAAGNWLLTGYPDLYLSAGLYGALTYTQDDRAPAFDALLQRQIAELNLAHEGLGARVQARPSIAV
jgi:hypothetical protein